MGRAIDRLAAVTERMLAVAFVFAVALNFVNVIERYVFNATMVGADEIEIYVMIWVTFLGAAIVSWRRQHLRMDVLSRMLPTAAQKLLRAAELLLTAAIGAFMLVNSLDYTERMYALGRTSDTAGVPLWTIHAAVPLGFALMAAISAWRLLPWAHQAGGADDRDAGVVESGAVE